MMDSVVGGALGPRSVLGVCRHPRGQSSARARKRPPKHSGPRLPPPHLQQETLRLRSSARGHALEGGVLARVDLHVAQAGEVRGLCCGNTATE